MDAVFAAADGKPSVQLNMICVYESYAVNVGWRQTESPITVMEVIIKVTLVVRMAASVIDWECQTDGLIRLKVGLNGILIVKGTKYENMRQVPEQENLQGTLLSENVT
ncbi:hypothetical protein SLA2020_068210 [Shorea laevis]